MMLLNPGLPLSIRKHIREESVQEEDAAVLQQHSIDVASIGSVQEEGSAATFDHAQVKRMP